MVIYRNIILYSKNDELMYLIDFGHTRLIEYEDGDLDKFDYIIFEKYLNALLKIKIGFNWISDNKIAEFEKEFYRDDLFNYGGDFISSVNFDKIKKSSINPNVEKIIKEEIKEEINEMLKSNEFYDETLNDKFYERDKKIFRMLGYGYFMPRYVVTNINIDKLIELLQTL